MKELFCGSLRLMRFMLRRERVASALWIVAFVFFSAGLIPVLTGMFGSPAEREALITTLDSPVMVAFMGPVFNDSFGGLYASFMMLWLLMIVGIVNIFLVVRLTRGDEERSRTEVIRSLPVGRISILNAATLTAAAINLALAVISGLCVAAIGAGEGMGFEGSMLYGAAMGVFGLFIAAVTAVFCQLCVSSRAAIGFSVVFLMVIYMMRSIGDIGGGAPDDIPVMSAISPLGLLLYTRVYSGDLWWPVFVVLAITAAVFIGAYALNRIRDMDQGFIPARPGRRNAAASLLSPLGLSWRLLRNTLVIWTLATFVLGASYGTVLGDIETFLTSNELYAALMVIDPDLPLAESFASTIITILVFGCAIPVQVAVLKLRNEEKDGRIEHILSRSVSRPQCFLGYLLLGFIMSVLLLFMAALGLYASSISVMDDPIPFSFLISATMVYAPAIWVMIGIAALLTGVFPKATAFCWAFTAYSLFSLFFGRVMELPELLIKITPFGHIPLLPVEDVNWLTLTLLTAVAAALTALGLVCYRRRDMA